ncbi:MAG: M23 family metallopeptidase [Deltaproteobacteria bacterium]|nr:M23 family metallopeptidase [Deltaproteobacteria bacterium]
MKRASGSLALLDFAAAGIAVYVMLTSTPVGALVMDAGALALDRPRARRPLASFFRAREEAVALVAAATPIPDTSDTSIGPPDVALPVVTATRASARPALLRAALDFAPSEPDAITSTLRELGLQELGPSTDPAVRDQTIAEALVLLSRRLGGEEPAVAALVLGETRVRRAMDRTRAVGRDPLRWSRFSRHLPATRRLAAEPFVLDTLAYSVAYELRPPLAGKLEITSRFGERTHPITGSKQHHRGLDLAAKAGTSVLASGRGIVSRVKEDDVNGRFVQIDHGFGVSTSYCHNDDVLVAEGQEVASGQQVSRSGNTGRSTGPHLHFQVEVGGKPIDPAPLIGLRSHAIARSSTSLLRVLARWWTAT